MTQSLTREFGEQFQAERTRLLRRRLMWYCGVSLAINVFVLLLGIQTSSAAGGVELTPLMRLIEALISYLGLVVYGLALLWAWRTTPSQGAILSAVFWLVGGLGAATILMIAALLNAIPAEALATAGPEEQPSPPPQAQQALLIGVAGAWSIFASHFFAALFIPWSAREAFRPLLVLIIALVIALLVFSEGPLWTSLAMAPVGALAGVPGLLIAWWRHSRLRDRFHYRALRGRYGEMKRELTDARRIHEALFPAPITEGPIRFNYCYEPMRQIGGDFLYAHQFPGLPDEDMAVEPLSVVLIDVTGHGIPAALTVNRLHGELQRIFAESPDIGPGDVLTSLNSYVHLTLATHSVYATAICLRIDPAADEIAWASGGHPPPFLCTSDGRFERLDSTALVLGACHGEDFQHGERRERFTPGDALLAYTDGAIEARNDHGRMLRMDGFQQMLLQVDAAGSRERPVCEELLDLIEGFRFGPADDDTLIVELSRPAAKA